MPTDAVVLSSQRLGDSQLGRQQALDGNKLGFRRGRYVTSGTPSLTLRIENSDIHICSYSTARYSQSTAGKPADTGLLWTSADNTSLWPAWPKVSSVPKFYAGSDFNYWNAHEKYLLIKLFLTPELKSTLRLILNVLAETWPGYRTDVAVSGTWKWHQKIIFKTKNNLDVWRTPVTFLCGATVQLELRTPHCWSF